MDQVSIAKVYLIIKYVKDEIVVTFMKLTKNIILTRLKIKIRSLIKIKFLLIFYNKIEYK
jgi:hypothetical protein